MESSDYKKILEEIVLETGEYVLSNWGKTIPLTKKSVGERGDKSRLEEKAAFSEVDASAEIRLIGGLKRNLISPESIYLIGEEETPEIESASRSYFSGKGFNPSGLTLIVDPIDGTRNYLSASNDEEFDRSKLWGVSTCLCLGKDPIAMAISYPAMGLLLSSEKSGQTRINEKEVGIYENIIAYLDGRKPPNTVN